MLLLLVPLYSLYEFAILAIRVTHWRASRKAAAADGSNLGDVEEEPGRNLGPKSSPGGGRVDDIGPI
jgi:sec-independent protein translocase protein TatC